jgi:16S rRNA (adenine1518-N6/adenine1519-N6)-dimethyltransferase
MIRDPWSEQFIPRKSLGQNFLINPHVVDRVVAACEVKPADIILEIGPGKGALTYGLSRHARRVIAVEKDIVLARKLRDDFNQTNVTVVQEDILKFPFEDLGPETKIIGNLPYNIATPIITKALRHRDHFGSFYMTVQWEYARRMAAEPNSENYGSFSCFTQYYADIKILFKINSSAFSPVPKVQSCFLRLLPLKVPRCEAKDEGLLFQVIRSCFGQRRKMIQNSLSAAVDQPGALDILQSLNIDPKLRAENLSLEDYVKISDRVSEMGGRQKKGRQQTFSR